MENEPFLLVETEDLSPIFAPLKTTTRIRYTCFNVSKSLLIFGATSGGLYVFRREPCCFLHILPNKEGSVTQVAISPGEKLIAFSTVKGIVCILERSSHGAKHVVTTSEHQNEQITCLQWNERNDELFVGDTSGKVSIVTASVFSKKSMFPTSSFVLMKLDSKIVQMDFSSNMLLVSTLTKCYICDTTKEIFRQVGHKLRDGEYGACFFNTQIDHDGIFDFDKAESQRDKYPNLSHLKLFCARPGSRLWEVAIDGTVISTHHFKEALAVPPKKIFFLNNWSSQNRDVTSDISTNGSCVNSEQINSNFSEQSFNFQKLYIILSKFFFTFKIDGIYIFDPQKAVVVLWNNEITNIVDVKCVNDVIYVWSGYGKMYALTFAPLEKFLVRFYFQKKYKEVVKLCLEFESFLLTQASNSNKLYILQDLDEKLKSSGNSEKISDQLKALISICKENAQKRKTQNAQKLKSGIYLVNNNEQSLLDDRRVANQKLLRPTYLNLKSRSHSVSPERFQNGRLEHHGSSSSLPDLVKERRGEESSMSASDIIVNGNEEKETKVAGQHLDFERILETCKLLRNSPESTNELVFNFFDQILALSDFNKLETDNNLELIKSFPLNYILNEEDLKFISDLFHSSLKTKSILDWLSKFNGASQTIATTNHPEFLVNGLSSQTLSLDYKLGKVLKIFSCLLKENEIVDLIKKLSPECYYSSLMTVLDYYHDSSLSSISVSSLASVTSAPKILNVAYFLLNVGQIDQCSKYSFKIPIEDMFYLILKFEQSLKKSGKSSEIVELQCNTMFLSFIDKASEDIKLLNDCNDLIENYAINCLRNISCTASCVKESNCNCGFPSPGLKPSMAMFPEIGQFLIEKTWLKSPTKSMEICGQVPYLWKYLIFIRRSEPLDTLLPLLIQYGEVQELESRAEEMEETIIESCIKYLIKLKSGVCLNCGEKISTENGTVSWTELGLLCIKLIGPKKTLLMYTKYSSEISSKELEQSFYQGLIFSTIMEKHSNGLRKNVVDLLMGKGTHELDRIPAFSEKIKNEIFGKSGAEKYRLHSNESNFHHWGVKVNFKTNCAVCSLPLDTKVLISETGLIVFKCSHTFHTACLRKVNLECPICTNKITNGE